LYELLAYHSAQLSYTTQHKTVQKIFSINLQTITTAHITGDRESYH